MCTRHYLSQQDLAVLHRFAREHAIDASSRDPSGRKLAALLASSLPLPETDAARRHVSLGATVHYRPDGARDLSSIVIACPYDANALLARVTILSPLALGLLGHAEGCSVEIALPNARSMLVDIVEVEPPAIMPPAPPYQPLCNPPERRTS